ncbi:hypothetical protein IJT10_08455 [bacterium]|nr:hypothetical protein [bacterium]
MTEKKVAARKAAEKKAAERRAESMSQNVKDKCWYATPELSGYLANLQRRWRLACGNTRVRLPLQNISGAWGYNMGHDACPVKGMQVHQRGVAVDLILTKVPNAQRKILENLIVEDFLLDFIYMKRYAEGIHLVLNPRYGSDFLDMYVQRVSPEGKIALAREELLAEENARRKTENSQDKFSTQDRDKDANILNRERKAKNEAKSRASAAKKRIKKEDKQEDFTLKEESSSFNATEEEEELYAIPDEIEDHSGKVTSRKTTKESANDVYSF